VLGLEVEVDRFKSATTIDSIVDVDIIVLMDVSIKINNLLLLQQLRL